MTEEFAETFNERQRLISQGFAQGWRAAAAEHRRLICRALAANDGDAHGFADVLIEAAGFTPEWLVEGFVPVSVKAAHPAGASVETRAGA